MGNRYDSSFELFRSIAFDRLARSNYIYSLGKDKMMDARKDSLKLHTPSDSMKLEEWALEKCPFWNFIRI